MKDDLHRSHTMQPDAPRYCVQPAAHRDLGISDAVVAALPPKTWVARRFASAYTSKKRLKGQIKTYRYVLQHLRLHVRQRRPGDFEQRQRCLLVIQTKRLLALSPGVPPRRQQVIIQPATLLKLNIKETLLARAGVQAVLKRL